MLSSSQPFCSVRVELRQLVSLPPLHGSSFSPNKVHLEYLWPFRLPLLPCSSKFPVSLRSRWTSRYWTGGLARQKPEQHFPLPMFPAYWSRSLQRLGTLTTLLGDEIFFKTPFCQIPSVSSEELALPRLVRCELSQLRCHGQSLLLSSYLCRIKRKNSSCSACGHPLQDLIQLLLDCPASELLRRAIFGTTSFIFALWSSPWVVARLLGLRGVPPRPHPSERVG